MLTILLGTGCISKPLKRATLLVAVSTVLLTSLLSGCQRQSIENKPAQNEEVQPESSDTGSISTQSTSTQIEATHANTPLATLKLPQSRADDAIQAEANRINPRIDGWNSEAFNEHALAQLKKLAAWLEQQSAPFPADVFTTSVKLSPLRPDTTELEQVFNKSGMTVTRWESQGEPNKFDASTRDMNQVTRALSDLLPVKSDVHAEFKIIGITTDDGAWSTKVRCHLSGKDSTRRLQQNLGWRCRWAEFDTDQPKIEWIESVQFEEVTSPAQKLFADRTNAVFQNVQCFDQQLGYPLDHWRDRLDWRFGWQVVGPHGIAVGDVNGDGRDDLYVLETGGVPNRLLVQQDDGTVVDISRDAGVDIIEPTQSALIIDLDNDGDQDIVATVARFVLVFENDGRGKFAQHPILETGSMIRSLAAADFNNDGLLDFYACGYSLRVGDSIGLGRPMPYHDANNGAPSYLLANQGGFRFEDVTADVGLDANNKRFSYAAAWEDFDNDGDLDLYVANDFGRNCLYRNDNGKFSDIAAQAGIEDIAAGMSVSWGDYNRDGLPDLYVGNMFSSAGNRIAYQRQFKSEVDETTRAMYQRHARGNSLFENVGDGTFRDVSLSAAVTEGRWSWSSNFVDINNDGWQDLVVANGMVTGTEDSGDL